MGKEMAWNVGYFGTAALVFAADLWLGHVEKFPTLRVLAVLILALCGARLAEAYLPILFH
jgi:hypothetical protein